MTDWAALKKKLNSKATFCDACAELAEAVGENFAGIGGEEACFDACARMMTVLRSRFSNPKFWAAALVTLQVLEAECGATHARAKDAAAWIAEALESVDEEAREAAAAARAKAMADYEKKHNQGQ